MAEEKKEKIILAWVAECKRRSEIIDSKCRLWNEKLFHEIGIHMIPSGMESINGKWKGPEAPCAGPAQEKIEVYEAQVQKIIHDIKEKQQLSYLSMADIVDISETKKRDVLKLKALAGQDVRLQGMLEECLSYLPYLEQMARTYGRVYLNPREASREIAPFMNRDLKALGR